MSTAVITGAGSGVGRAVALRFAGAGWNVALIGRRSEAIAETAALATAADRVSAFPCDVSSWESVAAMGTAVLRPVQRGRRPDQRRGHQRAAAQLRGAVD